MTDGAASSQGRFHHSASLEGAADAGQHLGPRTMRAGAQARHDGLHETERDSGRS